MDFRRWVALGLWGAVALAAGASEAPAAFAHPGVLNSRFELEYMKSKVAAGAQPWKTAFDRMRARPEASLAFRPRARAVVECGSGSNPNNGCTDERGDAQVAYLHALLWAVTGEEAHARKAAEILNAWSILRSHTNSNAMLQAGWSGGGFVRAAEILRHEWDGWTQADTDRFRSMMRTAFIPLIQNGRQPSTNGNWEAVMIEVILSFAVFDEDKALFAKGIELFRKRLPAYIYASEDGPVPLTVSSTHYNTRDKIIKHWHGQTALYDGLCQETCRDLGHTQMGFAGLINSAEVAWKQGIDLYAANGGRLMKGMEFHAKYMTGTPVPSNLCGGRLNGTSFMPAWEIGFNHYAGWKQTPMPHTEALLNRNRPEMYSFNMAWGTLSHYGMGASGQLPPGGAIGVLRPPASAAPALGALAFYDLAGRWVRAKEAPDGAAPLRHPGFLVARPP